MKAWHIQTWGAGTPHYLVSAETKEEAWKMVEEEWRRKKYGYKVGGHVSYIPNPSNKWTDPRVYNYQDIDDLIEIKGLTTQTYLIVDLNEN